MTSAESIRAEASSTAPERMQAMVIREFGPPSVLRLEEVATPRPAPHEILVRVHSVSVNRVYDLETRRGASRSRLVTLPLVLGHDPAGEVAAIGATVSGLAVGDRVVIPGKIPCLECAPCRDNRPADCLSPRLLGIQQWGGYAEYVAVPAQAAYKIPAELSFADATVIFRHFPAAYNLLLDRAGLQPGEWVLVMGASGALATSGIQVAKLAGATVIGAAGSSERVAIARSFGADHGIDYRSETLSAEVERLTGGRGVDVVFENVGDPELWTEAFGSMAQGGRLVTAGAHGGGQVVLDLHRLYLRRLRIIGGAGWTSRHLNRTVDDAAHGRIRAARHRVLPLQLAARAHDMLETDRSVGKIVLDPTLAQTSDASADPSQLNPA
jgi:NADPH:quinone reductase-like Zn-dependent oxidoreductase